MPDETGDVSNAHPCICPGAEFRRSDIDGIRAVIDLGLAREPRLDPNSGFTRLETVTISQASADQRAGRAGRVAPGVAYRLWPQSGLGAGGFTALFRYEGDEAQLPCRLDTLRRVWVSAMGW